MDFYEFACMHGHSRRRANRTCKVIEKAYHDKME